MKVIFLDFDGVLNSAASFLWEKRKKTGHIQDTLSPINCSTFQYILEKYPHLSIVISSTWRRVHPMDYLKAKLTEYGIDASRIIGTTPIYYNSHRGREIREYLDEHPEIKKYAVIDDDPAALEAVRLEDGVDDPKGKVFATTWEDGLSMEKALEVMEFLSDRKPEPKKEIDYSPFII